MYYSALYSHCIKLYYIYIPVYMYSYIYITVYHIVSYHIILCYTVLNKYYIYYFTYLLSDFKRSPIFILDPFVRLLSNFEGSTILRQTHPAGFCFCAQTSWGSIDWRYLGQISSHGPVSLQKVEHSTNVASIQTWWLCRVYHGLDDPKPLSKPLRRNWYHRLVSRLYEFIWIHI